MAQKKTLITKKKEQFKNQEQRYKESANIFTGDEDKIDLVYTRFILFQHSNGNSKATIDFYERFYKKLSAFCNSTFGEAGGIENCPINMIKEDYFRLAFIKSLGDVNNQTVNSYLRGYRALGNFAVKEGFLDSFRCPIKETAPEVKEVYTEAELKKLLVKPPVEDFEVFRTFTIINLLLSTGARTNTIVNLRIKDVDLDDGYINFNTTKAHKVVRIGLHRRALISLKEYIHYWRSGGDTEPTDYLFCNIYGEPLTRHGLYKAIERYNKSRGVNKTGIHLFRHTFAKMWITNGGDIISLAQVLTHSELDMVKRYANLYGADIKDKILEHSPLSQIRTNSGETIKTQKKNEET